MQRIEQRIRKIYSYIYGVHIRVFMENFAPKNGLFLTKKGFEQLKKNFLGKVEIFMSNSKRAHNFV